MSSNSLSSKSAYNFSKLEEVISIPDLLAIQVNSMEDFLQEEILPEKRENIGLEAVFRNTFPIEDNHKNYVLEYKYYYLGIPRYSVKEVLERRITYSVPLKLKFVLHITDENDRSKYIQSIEQDVFFGNIPYMTKSGTFIINGAERVIVSQLQRSPGVFFDQNLHPNGTKIYQARIIPFRGSWVDFTSDIYDCIYAIIDRRRKFPATLLLRAIGYSTNEDIFNAFGLTEEHKVDKNIIDQITISDIINKETGEVLIDSETVISNKELKLLKQNKVNKITLFKQKISSKSTSDNLYVEMLKNTMAKDPTSNHEEAVKLLYTHLRTGQAPNTDIAQKFIEKLFFSTKKYDLGAVGRYRINKKFDLDAPVNDPVLTKDDFINVFKYLISMRNGERGPDDIDHLGNRRVRTVGEQLQNQFNIALSRMQRTITERMNQREAESITPQDLINSRVISTVLNTFFGTSQLSQFMDQTNPLAEITHKRRISSLGPGGLSRERAGFEVRDVHYTHYGRLCPIETPEGPNIGLINSLATHAIVNNLGFIESPYRVVDEKHQISDEIKFLSPDEEDRAFIVQATEKIKKNKFTDKNIRARNGDNFPTIQSNKVNYVDVSPRQLVSVSAALIPFLENDDANRALMGSNMMRQSVPLMSPQAPIVGTGMEPVVARDSRACLLSDVSGKITYVDAEKIQIKVKDINPELDLVKQEEEKTFLLRKFLRSNQNTCINQRPRVKVGQSIKKGDVLADGQSTSNGELALGRNLKVAFMPWRGYNFEDAIVISEKCVKSDMFTSIHIKEFEVEIRDTKRGEEELTNEIPNVSEEATRNLDDRGIVRVGAEVESGDILVGKVTPKGETDPTPEEKLLKAIFGEKAGNVKDASKRCTSGVNGVVIETQLFERKNRAMLSEEKQEIRKIQKEAREQRLELIKKRNDLLSGQLIGQICGGMRDIATDKTVVKAKTLLTKNRIKSLEFDSVSLKSPWVEDFSVWNKILTIWKNYKRNLKQLEEDLEKNVFILRTGDELQQGVMKLAKVYIADKRKVSIGDKMAGRHGNKGIVALVVPEEDMPHTEDGTPVDLVLNPLGVPSRMNLGQLYETMLGWAGDKLGKRYYTPVFDGAKEKDVRSELKEAGLPESGKIDLWDGRTGEKINFPVTVGTIYFMKLSHLIALLKMLEVAKKSSLPAYV